MTGAYPSPIHRGNNCSCRDPDYDSRGWTCIKCRRYCAPCWGGYVNKEDEDVCGVCADAEQPIGIAITVRADTELAARIKVSAEHPNAQIVSVRYVVTTGTLPGSTYDIVTIDEGYSVARMFASADCRRDGQHSSITGNERCGRCGDKWTPEKDGKGLWKAFGNRMEWRKA